MTRQLEDVVENDSFDKQARALYFDLGTSGEYKNTGHDAALGQARTVDYIDGEFKA